MSSQAYAATFEKGPGGWLARNDKDREASKLDIQEGAAVVLNPSEVDYREQNAGVI